MSEESERFKAVGIALSSPFFREQRRLWEKQRSQLRSTVTSLWGSIEGDFVRYWEQESREEEREALLLTAMEDLPPMLGAFVPVMCPEIHRLIAGQEESGERENLSSSTSSTSSSSSSSTSSSNSSSLSGPLVSLMRMAAQSRENDPGNFELGGVREALVGLDDPSEALESLKLVRSLSILQFVMALLLLLPEIIDEESPS